MRTVSELLLRSFQDSNQLISNFRIFCYAVFVDTLVLMFLSFIIGKRYLSVAGTLIIYLPTFGYFTIIMFPLAGMGLLRVLWLPLLDFSPSLQKLGDIVFVPYIILINQFGILGYNFIETLSSALIVVGVFIFFLRVLTWIYAKFKGCEIVDFWIYRISRHPQYLGLLIWSYGLMMLTMFIPQFIG